MKRKIECSALIVLLGLTVFAYAQETNNGDRISEERFVHVNGIDQWVTIKGTKKKPAILFLHGGPGSPLSPYADEIFGSWEKDFILIQWDQRGAGKTYGHNGPGELSLQYLRSNPLTLDQMVADGIAIAEHMVKYLGKKKLILVGSSWGTVLGVKMAQARPDLFHAYVGHSQVVNPHESDLFAYDKVVELAKKANDTESLTILNQIGKPPYDTARNMGKLMRIVKKHQRQNATPAPRSWFTMPPKYNNDKDNTDRENGDDYSFVNYAGDKRLGVAAMCAKINFMEDAQVFKIPVYLIQGSEDLQTPAGVNQKYFSRLKAPVKEFTLVPKSEHGYNQAVIDAHLRILQELIVPKIQMQTDLDTHNER